MSLKSLPSPTCTKGYSIPTQQEPLKADKVDAFGAWIDEQLGQLEAQYAEFVTRESMSGIAR